MRCSRATAASSWCSLAVAILAATAAALVAAPEAAAHKGGKVVPKITARLEPRDGLLRLLEVRLVDADSGRPIAGARVAGFAKMTRPHVTTTYFDPLREAAEGVYRGKVRFSMPASWTVRVTVSGARVVETTASLSARVRTSNRAVVARADTPAVLAIHVDDRLTGRDLATIAVLWAHGAGTLAWLVGLRLLVGVVGTSSLLAPQVRARLVRPLLRVAVALHGIGIAVVVGTGIYNLRQVTPFALVWNPAERGRLEEIPYGAVYEAVLLAKLALFIVLVAAGTRMLFRLRAALDAHRLITLRHALGVSGAVYLATIPLILVAAAALRYVHVLSHVTSVPEAGG